MKKKERTIWKYIVERLRSGETPTIRQISADTEIAYSSVNHWLGVLIKKGWITRNYGSHDFHIPIKDTVIPDNVDDGVFFVSDLGETTDTIFLDYGIEMDTNGMQQVSSRPYATPYGFLDQLLDYDPDKTVLVSENPNNRAMAATLGYKVVLPDVGK